MAASNAALLHLYISVAPSGTTVLVCLFCLCSVADTDFFYVEDEKEQGFWPQVAAARPIKMQRPPIPETWDAGCLFFLCLCSLDNADAAAVFYFLSYIELE